MVKLCSGTGIRREKEIVPTLFIKDFNILKKGDGKNRSCANFILNAQFYENIPNTEI